jgi:hypothetical protein
MLLKNHIIPWIPPPPKKTHNLNVTSSRWRTNLQKSRKHLENHAASLPALGPLRPLVERRKTQRLRFGTDTLTWHKQNDGNGRNHLSRGYEWTRRFSACKLRMHRGFFQFVMICVHTWPCQADKNQWIQLPEISL